MMDYLKFLVPHFVTDDVGCYLNEDDQLYTAIAMDAWDEDEDPTPAAVVRVKCFSVFGIGLFGKVVGDAVDYDEWLNSQA